MEIREFSEKICSAVKEELGDAYRVELKEVRKINGVILHGLLILDRSNNVAPTIYLETFLEDYETGTTFAAVVRQLLDIYRRDALKDGIDMDFFRTFDRVKDRICYRLIGRRGNEELLEDIPYIEFLDLAVCFYYAYRGNEMGEGMILIHNSHMELWQTCTAELFALAKTNTQRLFPWVCSSLRDVMQEIMEGEESDENLFAEVPMKVLSNVKRVHGAVCMLYPEVLSKLAREEGRNLYILPSSIHEVILLADTGAGSARELKKMIVEVNSTQVSPEEVLSDSLYYYDSAEKRVKIIF